MTTVVNTPGGNNGDSGMGFLAGIIVLLIVAVLFFVYVVPAIRGSQPTQESGGINVDVKLPSGGDNSGGNSGGQSY